MKPITCDPSVFPPQPGAAFRTGVWITRRTLYLLFPVVLACGDATSAPPMDVVARVEHEAVQRTEFEAFLNDHGGDPSGDPLEDAVLSRLLDRFLDERLLLRLASEKGFKVPTNGTYDSRQVLSFLADLSPSEGVSQEEIEAYYNANFERYQRLEEVHLRQILVMEKSQAEKALAVLRSGKTFSEVAAQFSQGPRSQQGGDQGRLSRADLPPDFIDTIFGLEPGEVSDIVTADYGFHIFQVLEMYPEEVVSIEQAAEDIRREIWRQQADEQLEQFFKEARERYNVEIFETNLSFEYRGHYASQPSTHQVTAH